MSLFNAPKEKNHSVYVIERTDHIISHGNCKMQRLFSSPKAQRSDCSVFQFSFKTEYQSGKPKQ